MIFRLHRWAAVPLISLLSSGSLGAQEVRRALPVETPEAVPSQPRAPGVVPRALPVTPDTGAPSILDQNINPAAVKTLKPEPTPTSPGTVAEPDVKAKEVQNNNDEIRLAPGNGAAADSGDPAKTQLGIADGLYLRKMYDLAIPEYEKYLGEFEGDADRASAMYRLAECYAKLGQEVPALNTYRLLIDEVGQGEFVGSAAFRLATRAFDRGDYLEAAPLFGKAYDNAKAPEIKVTARYYQAKCLELTGRKADARAVYEDVVRSNNDKNPYRDAANLSLAYLALENNEKPEALARFDQLGHEAAKPVVRAEALTRAGILASDLKQRDKAEQRFKDAIALNTPGKWKQVAQLELMKLQYDGDRFSQVLDSFSRNASSLNDETRPTVLLMVANSYRQLGKYPKALEVYNQLLRRYPDTAEATDARFQRLVTLDVTKDPNLVSEVDAFLATNPARDRADKAKLLKAQTLVQQNRYQAAAALYLELGQSSLPDAYRADCCYAAGYSLSQVNDAPGAIEAFSVLINRYPHYKMITKALLKRALLYQGQRNYAAAIADLNQVISQGNPGTMPERETALLEKGLTLGQQQDYLQMSATFRQLLQEYPHSSGAAQANYWIGWAAFEAKRYADAIGPLNDARKLNPEEYGDKVALRLLFCNQVLNRPEDAGREIDNFTQGDLKRVSVVADGCRWVGGQFYNARNFAGAAKYLGFLAKTDERDKLDAATWLMLGRSDIEQKQFSDAIEAINAYLTATTDPADRAQGFLALGRAQLGAIQADAATKSAEQAMSLQPEGRLNADARMLIGDIDTSKGDYETAAKSYLSVAVLYEDPEVTPHALDAAYRAFQKAGNQDQASKTLSELKNRYPAYEMRASAS